MIDITNQATYGWEAAIRGMRNPMNSWEKSDSGMLPSGKFFLGIADYELATTLRKAGSDHSKFMRMIHVTMDITAPLYWWKEFDTYKVGTVANSCSTMHKIGEKEFEASDFSIEHLGVMDYDDEGNECFRNLWIDKTFKEILDGLNIARNFYIRESNPDLKKAYWWQMIQLLPTSYNQKRTVDINYQVLTNMYHARKNHKLDEWHIFCDRISELPYAKGLIVDPATPYLESA